MIIFHQLAKKQGKKDQSRLESRQIEAEKSVIGVLWVPLTLSVDITTISYNRDKQFQTSKANSIFPLKFNYE